MKKSSKKTLLFPALLLVAVVALFLSVISYKRVLASKDSSFSRNLYCSIFKFSDKTCNLNNIWVAKDNKSGEFVIVKGNSNTAILDTYGAKTVLEFTRDSTGSEPVTCLAGPAGTNGTNGVNGANGAAGTNGTNGATGATGAAGSKGDTGATGATGAAGSQGAQGEQGAQGAQGSQGAQGEQGNTGAAGADGVCTIGDTGPQGPPGPQGDTGTQGTQGIQGIQGIQGVPGITNGYFGSFYDTTSQTGNANIVLTMNVGNSDPWNNGVSMTNGSKITIANPGVYNIAFSAQMVKNSGNSATHAHIWLSQNGTDVPISASQIGFPSNSIYYVPAWNFFFKTTAANEYVQLKWEINSNVNNAVSIQSQTAVGTIPAIPGLIVTVNQVGQ